MRIAIIASARYPLREPFAGGLEMITHAQATRLRERGHDVTVFASADSDPGLGVEPVCPRGTWARFSEAALDDESARAEGFMEEHHAYLRLMLRLPERDLDIVQNNSLHYLPVAMAEWVDTPIVTTLHTPPTPWLESAIQQPSSHENTHFVSVSRSNAKAWASTLTLVDVIHNGIDLTRWRFEPEAEHGHAVWTGRITPEKGTHLAIQAARKAGLHLSVAGPVSDQAYFEREVAPLLDDDRVHVGHLDHTALARLVGSAAVLLATPCWDEPYGLVVAEALACGTPVAAFDRGAMPELLGEEVGRLAPAGDVGALAEAAHDAQELDRRAARRHAEEHCSIETMVDRYEDLYHELAS